jgi:hypothetical protein
MTLKISRRSSMHDRYTARMARGTIWLTRPETPRRISRQIGDGFDGRAPAQGFWAVANG